MTIQASITPSPVPFFFHFECTFLKTKTKTNKKQNKNKTKQKTKNKKQTNKQTNKQTKKPDSHLVLKVTKESFYRIPIAS